MKARDKLNIFTELFRVESKYSLTLMDTLGRIEMHHVHDVYAYRDRIPRDRKREIKRERLFHLSYLLHLVNRKGQLRLQKT